MGAHSSANLPAGRHVLAELTGCSAEILNDPPVLEACLQRCAKGAGATLVSSHFHHFSPHGVSGVLVIAESHVTIHTWPELGYAAVDVFTCGMPEIAEGIMNLCVAELQPTQVYRTSFSRGPQRNPELC